MENLAEQTYEAFRKHAQFNLGRPLPSWGELTPYTQAPWHAVAAQLFGRYNA